MQDEIDHTLVCHFHDMQQTFEWASALLSAVSFPVFLLLLTHGHHWQIGRSKVQLLPYLTPPKPNALFSQPYKQFIQSFHLHTLVVPPCLT